MALHPHGTLAKYAQGCPCGLCALAHSIYYPAPAPAPAPRFVDVTPAREHLRTLRADGWTYRKIAERSGYHENSLRKIVDGYSSRASEYTVQDLLEVGA